MPLSLQLAAAASGLLRAALLVATSYAVLRLTSRQRRRLVRCALRGQTSVAGGNRRDKRRPLLTIRRPCCTVAHAFV